VPEFGAFDLPIEWFAVSRTEATQPGRRRHTGQQYPPLAQHLRPLPTYMRFISCRWEAALLAYNLG
jgi:hypothetical protein